MAVFFLHPAYLVTIGFIIQTILVIIFLMRGSKFVNRSFLYRHAGLLTIGVVYVCLTIECLGTILVSSVQGWYTFTWQLVVAVILGCFLSIIYFIGGILILPTMKNLILHGITILYEFIWIYGVVGTTGNYILAYFFAIPLVAMPVINFSLNLIPYFKIQKPLWDKSNWFFKWYTGKVNFILWCIVAIEALLLYRGYSLLIWV